MLDSDLQFDKEKHSTASSVDVQKYHWRDHHPGGGRFLKPSVSENLQMFLLKRKQINQPATAEAGHDHCNILLQLIQ